MNFEIDDDNLVEVHRGQVGICHYVESPEEGLTDCGIEKPGDIPIPVSTIVTNLSFLLLEQIF